MTGMDVEVVSLRWAYNDALAVLAELAGGGAPECENVAADALGLLALVADQDVEPAQGSDGTDGRWRIARRVAPDRVISTVDPEARHTRKSKSARRDGFRGHVSAESGTGLITDCELTKASGEEGSDAVVGEKMIARDRYHQPGADSDGADPVAPTDSEPADARAADHAAAQSDTTGSTPPGKESASSVGAVVDAGVEHADGGAAAEQRQGLRVS
jgi:hypothetical protein